MGARQSMSEGAAERLAPLLKEARSPAEYQRVQCVWLRAALGRNASQIAQALGWQASSVRPVQARYFRAGEEMLRDQPRGGRYHSHLTAEEEERLLAPFLEGEAGRDRHRRSGAASLCEPTRLPSPSLGCLSCFASARLAQSPASAPAPEGGRGGPGGVSKKFPALVPEEAQQPADEGRAVRVMFEDEARFGRIREPHRCWAPAGVRPSVPVQMGREYEYAYAAVSPHDGVLDTLGLPQVNTEAMGVFLAEVAQRHADEFIRMVLDGAGGHRAKRLSIPANMRLVPLPPWSPPLNPAAHVWDE